MSVRPALWFGCYRNSKLYVQSLGENAGNCPSAWNTYKSGKEIWVTDLSDLTGFWLYP